MYDIQLNLTFETEVPPPILVPSPLYISYGVNFTYPENETDGSIIISNPGLISIFNVTVNSSFLAGVNISFPTGMTFFIDEIKAKSSVTIPYHLNVTSVSCGEDSRRNNIQIRGDYIYFEENSDVTHNVYLSSEIPVFISMYNCPISSGPTPVQQIEQHFRYSYHPPGGSYSPGGTTSPTQIQYVETVRERVKLSISQQATLERDAFAASLELTNKLADKSIENVKASLEIKDTDGGDASGMFFVNQTFLDNINSIDGSGVIDASSIATADWLLIPTPGAGGTTPAGKDYTVQAFIDYSVDGVSFSVNSTEESINVLPQPLLNLTYLIPGEVKADTPFNLTLNVTNVGYGVARNLKLDSAQPMIYENKAGLLVSFKLIGSGIVGGTEGDSMLINFGDIAPGQSKEAYWIMTASLDGEFTEFKGSFSHNNELGGAETSLIKNITYLVTQFTAEIISPEDGGIYYDTDSIVFEGVAHNGTEPFNYEWTSPITGTLSNDRIFIKTLKEGTYNVTLKVTDIKGGTDTDKRTISVINGSTFTIGKLKTVVLFNDSNQIPSATKTFDNLQTYLTINKTYRIGISTTNDTDEISYLEIKIYNSNDELEHSISLKVNYRKESSVTYINSIDSFIIPEEMSIGSDYYMIIEGGGLQEKVPLYLSPFEIQLVKEDMNDFNTESLDGFLNEIRNYNAIKYYNIVPYNWKKDSDLVIIADPVYEQQYVVEYYKNKDLTISNEQIDSKLTNSLLRLQLKGLSEIVKKWPDAKIIIIKGSSRDSNHIERLINGYRDLGKKVMIVGALPHEKISFNNFISTKAYKASYISYFMANQINEQIMWGGEDKVFTADHFRANQYFNALNSLNKYNKQIYGDKGNDYPAIVIAKKEKPLLQISPTLGKDLREDIKDINNTTLYKVGNLKPIGHTYYLGLSAKHSILGGFEIGQSHTSFILGPDLGLSGAYFKAETNKYEDKLDMDLIIKAGIWDLHLLDTPKTIKINENLDYEKIQMEKNNLIEQLKKEIPLYLNLPCLGDTIGDTRIPTGLLSCSPFTIKDVIMPYYDFEVFFNTPHAFISNHETLQYTLEPSSSHTILSDSLKQIGTIDRPISETVIYQNLNYPSSIKDYNFVNAVVTGTFEVVGAISGILTGGVEIKPTFTGTPNSYTYVGNSEDINAILVGEDILTTIITDSIKYSNDEITADTLNVLESFAEKLDEILGNKVIILTIRESETLARTFDSTTKIFKNGEVIPVSHMSIGQLYYPSHIAKGYSIGIQPNTFLDSNPIVAEKNFQIVNNHVTTDIKDLSIKADEYISLDTTNKEQLIGMGHVKTIAKKIGNTFKYIQYGLKAISIIYGSILQYNQAQEIATFNANQLYYLGDPYLTGYDDPIYNDSIIELPKNINVELSSEPFNVSLLNTTFIYPNVTNFEMPNITAKIVVEDWLPYTGAPQTPVFTISILHPSNQVIDSIYYNLFNEVYFKDVDLSMGVLKSSDENIPGIIEDYDEFPSYKLISGSEKLGNVTHTVLKVFPTTYFPNKTLVYYKNISINISINNITKKDVEVHLQPYPNILSIPENSEANISFKVYNDFSSTQNATVDVMFYPPDDLTFNGSDTIIELGQSAEDYFKILTFKIISHDVNKKKNFLLNATLKYNNGMEIEYKNYSIPIIVIDEGFTDLEIFDVSMPDKMNTMQSYNISAKVKNAGISTIIQIPVKLFLDSELVELTTISEIKPTEIIIVNFTYTPDIASIHNLTAAISAAPYEVNIQNNIFSKQININDAPIANMTFSPENLSISQEITFNATLSYDTDGHIVRYEWEFGDGNTQTTTEMTIIHYYASKGIYQVNLTVVDDEGAVNSISKVISDQSSLDITPPSIITNMLTSEGPTWLNFTWLTPPDPDFNHTILYLNGAFLTNVPAPQNYFNITGLTPDTQYELGTQTADTSGNINSTWVNATARTIAAPDTAPPVITNVSAVPANDSAVITWDSNEASDSLVKYGASPEIQMKDNGMVLNHTLTLSGLEPDKVYNYVVNSTDANGNSAQSSEHTFRTLAVQDTIAPVIDSITLYPGNTTAGSIINITVNASDNKDIVNVTADGASFSYSDGSWQGSIKAASSVGSYTVLIKAKDAAGNEAQTSVKYTVVNKVGGIAITSIPKPLSIVRGSSGQLNIKLISTANIDDRVWVNITTTGISASSAVNLSWFNRTSVLVEVPSKATVYVPIRVTVPSEGVVGYKTFKNNARSLGFNATSVDTGMVNVR